jgi:autotransporter-associated beta strand protein
MLAGGVVTPLLAPDAHAQNATWKGTTSGEWTLGTNWSSAPSVPTGTATFTTGAATTSVFNNNVVNIGALVFTDVPNAPAYTFNVNRNFAINGIGVVNNSASTQTFIIDGNSRMVFNSGSANGGSGKVIFNVPRGSLEFANSSTAGRTTINATGGLGIIEFGGSANAGHATINAGGLLAEFGGSSTAANATINNIGTNQLRFSNSANAGNATIINSGNSTIASGFFSFNNTSSAAHATITSSGFLNFEDSSSAGNATINQIASNKTMVFNTLSTAGNAHIINDGSSVRFGGFDAVASPTAANAIIENKNHGSTEFVRQSTAGNATISNSASAVLSFGHYDTSLVNNVPTFDLTKGTGSAGNATIINTESGATIFYNQSTAGAATITNNSVGNHAGGVLAFFSTSDGSTARVFNNIRGLVDISNATTGTSIGSVEGDGNIYLGSKKLTLGNTNIALATIGGVISDCGPAGNNCVTGAGSVGGSLLKTGTGALILSGANTYTGGTTISAGTLQLGNGGASGSIVGNVLDNGTFAINRSDAVTFGVVISGTGAFQQLGAGTTTLTNTNTYTGPTTVTAGTLTISASGSITSNVTNNATFNNMGTVTGSLTNSGTANNSGTISSGLTNSGMVNASGTVNGAIANNAGTFNVTGNLIGNGTFANAAAAVLAVGSTGAYTLQGVLTNSGAISVANGGQLTAIVGGITNNAGGTITVAAGGTVKDDLKNASLVTNAGTYLANVATNTGVVANQTGGTWTGNLLSNTGTVTNQSGATWSGNAANNPGGTLNNSGTWSGAVANAGTFNNDVGATVSGLLTNTAGTTTNNGALNGGAVVSGGMLAGAGTVANLTIANGATFAPGNGTPGSSMTVAGNLAFQSGALYLVALNPATSTFASVSGSATLNGGAGAAFLSGNSSAMPTPRSTARRRRARRRSSSAGACGRRASAARKPPTATRRSDRTTPPAASSAPRSAPTIASRRTRWRALRSPAAAPISASMDLGSGRSDLFQAGAFVRHNVGAAYLSGALAYGWQDITTDRTVTIAGIDRLRAQFNANAFRPPRRRLSLRDAVDRRIGLTPYAAGQFTTFDLPAYAEQAVGANTFALAMARRA